MGLVERLRIRIIRGVRNIKRFYEGSIPNAPYDVSVARDYNGGEESDIYEPKPIFPRTEDDRNYN